MSSVLIWSMFFQVELLQYTDALTLKYLLTNSRLDIFCPEIKTNLNSYLEENQKFNKRHGSGGNKLADSQIQVDHSNSNNSD